MRAGLHGLGLRPTEFWALTPLELMIMLGRDEASRPGFTRARLEALLQRYPDAARADRKDEHHGDAGRAEHPAGRAGSADRDDLGQRGGLRFKSGRDGPQSG
ncbi:phage tail assembly chaperone [Rhodobacter sp. NTK016B]|uniref:phage tail assembly chaperone n=1 Tax=Rhodobacter sp. NTK016B TaxID=2759676 RepID=UPI0039C992C6